MKKRVWPPSPPFVPPLVMSVALPAEELERNVVFPPVALRALPPKVVTVALPAVEVSPKEVLPASSNGVKLTLAPPRLLIVAPSALELSRKIVRPPLPPMTGGMARKKAPSLVITAVPAFAVFLNTRAVLGT